MDDIRLVGIQSDVEKFEELRDKSAANGGLQGEDVIALQGMMFDLAMAAPWLFARIRELDNALTASLTAMLEQRERADNLARTAVIWRPVVEAAKAERIADKKWDSEEPPTFETRTEWKTAYRALHRVVDAALIAQEPE